MLPFELHQPSSTSEAIDLLDRYGEDARPIAGGTALVLLMQQRLVRPEHLVSLNRIRELDNVEADGQLRVGAAVIQRRMESDQSIRKNWPLLAQTYQRVATVRIRHMATVGGGLSHADPNMDPPATLVCLDAKVVVQSKSGTREIPIEDFYTGYYETALQPGEIVTHLVVPRPSASLKTAYIKFLPRTADDYPTVAAATAVTLGPDGKIADARLALNAVGPTVVRAKEAENILKGQTPSDEVFRAAAATVPPLTDPTSDHRGSANYKKRMSEVFARRVLEQALNN
jgi:carbon-monoxide dehydrogenase medium subunit